MYEHRIDGEEWQTIELTPGAPYSEAVAQLLQQFSIVSLQWTPNSPVIHYRKVN